MSTMLFWFLACAFPQPDCTDGYERNESGTCVVLPDVEDDTGLASLEGAYQGDISIDINADAGDLPIEDVCTGTVAFDLSDGVLDGLVRCAFSGTVAGVIGTDPFECSMDGTVAGNGSSSGQILLDLGTFGLLDETWTGAVSAEQIDGSFDGTMTFVVGALEVPVQLAGVFSAEP